MHTTNWGIIGLGKIAHKFASDLKQIPNARLHAVASQSLSRAQAFAEEYQVPHAFGSYDDIVHCPDLHVVYIATPHVQHCANTLLCLQHGIPVLCEKPFAMNAQEAQQMIMTARAQGTFLMEALWTRFLPTIEKTLQIIDAGTIGSVLSIKADFGFKAPFDPQSRIFNRALGGGALLDIGIYPAFLALLLLGQPQQIKALAQLGSTGVDEDLGAILQYSDGRLAHLHATLLARTKTEAFIYGEKGLIHLHTRWHEPTSISLLLPNERPQLFQFDFKGYGYAHEAMHVMQCLQESKTESPLLPMDFSLELIALLDAIRQEAGIRYDHVGMHE